MVVTPVYVGFLPCRWAYSTKPAVVFMPTRGRPPLLLANGAHAASTGLEDAGFRKDGGGVLPFVLIILRLHLWEGVCPLRTAVVVSPPHCGIPSRLRMAPVQRGWRWCSHRLVVGFPSFSRMAWVQRGRRWCLRRLCWPTAGVAGLLWGCAGSEDGGGYLAASCSALAMRLTLWGVVDDVAVPIVAHRRVAMSCWQPTPLGSS